MPKANFDKKYQEFMLNKGLKAQEILNTAVSLEERVNEQIKTVIRSILNPFITQI